LSRTQIAGVIGDSQQPVRRIGDRGCKGHGDRAVRSGNKAVRAIGWVD
jgi:hypothetical protein